MEIDKAGQWEKKWNPGQGARGGRGRSGMRLCIEWSGEPSLKEEKEGKAQLAGGEYSTTQRW